MLLETLRPRPVLVLGGFVVKKGIAIWRARFGPSSYPG
jgi:hypothetical protein